jgi:hypothetical protein
MTTSTGGGAGVGANNFGLAISELCHVFRAKFTPLLLLLLACNGCASPAERQAALKVGMDAWSDCVMRAVSRLDDGKSDPMSIAYGVAPNARRSIRRSPTIRPTA